MWGQKVASRRATAAHHLACSLPRLALPPPVRSELSFVNSEAHPGVQTWRCADPGEQRRSRESPPLHERGHPPLASPVPAARHPRMAHRAACSRLPAVPGGVCSLRPALALPCRASSAVAPSACCGHQALTVTLRSSPQYEVTRVAAGPVATRLESSHVQGPSAWPTPSPVPASGPSPRRWGSTQQGGGL